MLPLSILKVFFLILKKIEILHRIQNQAARMLKRIPIRNHITSVLNDLHWLQGLNLKF